LKKNKYVKLGQNFLINKGIAKKTVEALFPVKKTILEIGPGKGILTDLLIDKLEKKNLSVNLILIELDEVLALALREKDSNYTVINDNITNIKLCDFNDKNVQIIGNVPYYISKEIIDWVILNENYIDSGVLMFQKEFIEKLLYPKDIKDKNPQGLIFNYIFAAEKIMAVSPGSFFPIPKVSSSVFRFDKAEKKNNIDVLEFYEFLKICFKKRRKTLLNNLVREYKRDFSEIVEKIGKSLTVRAEELDISDLEKFFLIYKKL